jgi:hypothetical protein
MASGVAEEGHEIHLRREGKPESLEPQPLVRGLVVEDPDWPVGEMGTVVAQLEQSARMEHGLVLAAVCVDLSVGEVAKATGVVEVEVGHHDVLDRLGLLPQARELADGGVLGIVRAAQGPTEEADQGPWGHEVVDAEARIDENESLIGVDEQAGRPHVPAREHGGHRCAVEEANGHDPVSGCCAVWRSESSSLALSRFTAEMATPFLGFSSRTLS